MIGHWRERGYVIPWKMLRVTMGAMPPLFKMILRHPVYIMKSNRHAKKNPVDYGDLSYTIPPYKESMKYKKGQWLTMEEVCKELGRTIKINK